MHFCIKRVFLWARISGMFFFERLKGVLDMTKITREQFMAYYRDVDVSTQELSVDDCREIFAGILKGSSDFTVDFLQAVLGDYSADHIKVSERYEHDRSEMRALVYKGYECKVIHEMVEFKFEGKPIDEQPMYVCNDDEWELSDEALTAHLVKLDVIPETDEELTLEQAVHVVLKNYKDASSNNDWNIAMQSMQNWVDSKKVNAKADTSTLFGAMLP
jgi:hypothetical protein